MTSCDIRPSGNASLPCEFVVAVWGGPYLEMLSELALPTWLAPGNLPAFATKRRTHLTLYTTPEGSAFLTSTPAWQRLTGILDAKVSVFGRSNPAHPMDHLTVWQKGIDQAQACGRFAFMLAPDTVWADGSLSYVEELISAGKQLIFILQPRVAHETASPEIRRRFTDRTTGAISIPPEDLAGLLVRHMEFYTASSVMPARRLPIHLEQLLWPTAEGGIEARALAMDPRGLDTSALAFRPYAFAITSLPDPSKAAFVTDFRRAAALSLTPAGKDFALYALPNPAGPEWAGRWWLRWHDAATRHFPAQRFRLAGEANHDTTGRVEGRLFTRAAAAAHDLMAIASAMRARGLRRAAQYLALGIETAQVHRYWPHDRRLLVLAPVDGALPSLDSTDGARIAADAVLLRRAVVAHARWLNTASVAPPAAWEPAGEGFDVLGHHVQPVSRPLIAMNGGA